MSQFFDGRFVGFVGSRSLRAGDGWLFGLLSAVCGSGFRVGVGCCVGSDAAVLSAASGLGLLPRCSVFAAFGSGGAGSCPGLSAVAVVLGAASAGASVSWLAGGGVRVPVRARLVRRSLALVSSPLCSGVVCLLASPAFAGVSGSWAAARAAAGRGLPVVVVLPGVFGSLALPALCGRGAWVRVFRPLSGCSCFRWVPAQQVLSLSPCPFLAVSK